MMIDGERRRDVTKRIINRISYGGVCVCLLVLMLNARGAGAC